MQDVDQINDLMAVTPIHGLIGLHCVEVTDGRAVCELPLGEHVGSLHAPLHGGMISLLADVTNAIAMSWMFEDGKAIPVSVDLNVRFFGQPKASPVTAEAVVVHRGSKIVGTECVVRDAEGRQVARTTASYMVLAGFGDLSAYQQIADRHRDAEDAAPTS
jgi:uncharacterized protein (TIGR00369 family)